MSSKIKAVIISSIVLVLLIGAIVALKLTENTDSDSSSSSSESSSVTSQLLYEKKQEDVASVHIINSNGEYDITQIDDETWTIKDLSDIPLDSSVLKTITSAVTSVTAQKIVEENVSDLSKYGLDNPIADVTVSFKDGDNTVKELLIGNETPTSGQSYFAFKGEDTVYAVTTSTYTSLTQGKLDAVVKSVLDKPDANDEGTVTYPTIQSVNIQRADLNYDINLEYDPDLDTAESTTSSSSSDNDFVHVLKSPINASLDTNETVTSVIRGMFGLTASSAAIIHPTNEELSNSGISAPSCVITTVIEDKTYTLTIGSALEDGSGYYGCFDGIDILYVFNESSLPWLTVNTEDLLTGLLPLNFVYDVAKLEIITPDDDVVFELTGDTSDDFKVTKDDVEMDGDYFRDFYQFILSAPCETLWLEDPASATPDVKFIYTMDDGTVTNTEFYILENSRQTIIKQNGVTCYKCRTAYIERLLSNLALLDDKGDIVMNW